MKTIKVLDIQDYIHLVCVKDLTIDCNQYRLYIVYKAMDPKYGYCTQHKKCIAKYGDMSSVLCQVRDLYIHNVQYRPIDYILAWNKQYYNS